ncbi:MAG: tetratricopeptide repeat protein [Thermoanaerobaculia bacterium]
MTRSPLLSSMVVGLSGSTGSCRRLCLPLLALVLALLLLSGNAAAWEIEPTESSAQQGAAASSPSSMEEELELRRRMMTHPEQPEIYLELADLQVSRSATDEALTMLAGSSRRFLGSGEPKKAVMLLSKAVELRPEDPELQLLLGKAHTQNRDFEAAEGPLRKALELGSQDPSALVFLGAILWESGRMEEAEPVYRQAIEATGRAHMPLSQLGRLLLWQGQYQEATELLREASQRSPQDVGTLFDLAEALRGSNQNEEAIATYRRVVLLAPNLNKAHYGLAILLARQGDREGSKAEFEIYNQLILAAEENNRMAEIEEGEVDRARLMLRQGQVEEAIAHLDSLEETVEVLLVMAQAYRATGELEASVESLQRAVVLDPSRQDVRQMLTSLRMEMAQSR